ncbi:hypothetical protein GCM10027048_17450 [Hymenobacter coalescens]
MKTFAAFRFFLSVLALALVAFYSPAASPKAAASKGQLTGALRDGTTHEPIPQANVVLLRAADGAYVATAATRADGTFEFRNVPYGHYRLHTTVLGYQPLRPVFGLSAQQPQLTLGAVELTPFSPSLAGKLVAMPQTAAVRQATKVGNAGRYVLASARQQRLTAPRQVQL